MRPRIAPANPPYPPAVQASLDRIMPKGVPPLTLFTTLACDERLFNRFFSGGLLDKGHLSIRERELVIHRVTAHCGSEYEWGVHATFFASRIELSDEHIHSLVHGNGKDACWDTREGRILDMCDELWDQLRNFHSENAMVELLMLAGYYRTVSYLTNALQLPLEVFGRRFPGKEDSKGS